MKLNIMKELQHLKIIKKQSILLKLQMFKLLKTTLNKVNTKSFLEWTSLWIEIIMNLYKEFKVPKEIGYLSLKL